MRRHNFECHREAAAIAPQIGGSLDAPHGSAGMPLEGVEASERNSCFARLQERDQESLRGSLALVVCAPLVVAALVGSIAAWFVPPGDANLLMVGGAAATLAVGAWLLHHEFRYYQREYLRRFAEWECGHPCVHSDEVSIPRSGKSGVKSGALQADTGRRSESVPPR